MIADRAFLSRGTPISRLDRTATTASLSPSPALPPLADESVYRRATDVRAEIAARRLRDGFFGAELFADPVWDILLDLYAAAIEGRQVSISSACIAAAVPPTTGLRQVARVIENGLAFRYCDPEDRRRSFVSITGRAFAAMRAYRAEVARRAPLPKIDPASIQGGIDPDRLARVRDAVAQLQDLLR